MTTTQHAYPGGLYTTTNIAVSGVGREGANNEGLEKRRLDGQWRRFGSRALEMKSGTLSD